MCVLYYGYVHSNNEFKFEFYIRNLKPYDGPHENTIGLLHRILSDSELVTEATDLGT